VATRGAILLFCLGSGQEQLEDFPDRDGFPLVAQREPAEGLRVGVGVDHDALLHRQHAGNPLALFRERWVHVLRLGLGVEDRDELGGGDFALHGVGVEHAVVAAAGVRRKEFRGKEEEEEEG